MRIKTLAVLLVLFGILSANAAFAGEMEELTGLEWRVTEIRYEDGEMRETMPNTRVSAIFSEDGDVSGSAGCNRYFANYSTAENSIKIGAAATTRMLCSSPKRIMEQEAAFLRGLKNAAEFSISEGELKLLDSVGRVVMILVDVNSEIFNQTIAGMWVIENMDGKRPLPGTEITMVFTEDGKVAGKATINNYFASWIESDGLILFSHAGSTMMAGSEEQMRQESEFLKILGRVRRYTIRDGSLILTTAEGVQITAARTGAK